MSIMSDSPIARGALKVRFASLVSAKLRWACRQAKCGRTKRIAFQRRLSVNKLWSGL